MGRSGEYVGEVGVDGLWMGDRGRSRRIYLVAVIAGVFAASALNADIGSPPDSVFAAFAVSLAYMQNLEGVLWDFLSYGNRPMKDKRNTLRYSACLLWLRMAWKSAGK